MNWAATKKWGNLAIGYKKVILKTALRNNVCKLPHQMKLYLIIWYLPHEAKAAFQNEAASIKVSSPISAPEPRDK